MTEAETQNTVEVAAEAPELLGNLGSDLRPELLEWAFRAREDGTSDTRAVACLDESDESPLAALAALRVPALFGEDTLELLHVFECRVDARAGGLRNPGRFARLAESFARRFGGQPPDDAPFLYGVPTRSAWRIAKERLDAKLMRTQNVLRARCTDLDLPATSAASSVREAESFPEAVHDLARAAAATGKLVTRPTAADLDRRFVDHPTAYRIALAESAGTLAGWAVLRPSTTADRTTGVVAAWHVPEGAPAVAVPLLDWLRQASEEAGCEELAFTVPDTRADWIGLQTLGFRVHASPITIAARHFHRQFTMRWLFHHWSYDLADLDLR